MSNKLMILKVLFFVFLLNLISSFNVHAELSEGSKVCYKENCFAVEIAVTEQQRIQGLQNRERMDDDKGMLFIFPQARKYNFWMKNTKFPLDIIWMNKNHKVVYIKENVPPCLTAECPTYPPSADALYVLELNAGQVQRIGLKVGNKVKF